MAGKISDLSALTGANVATGDKFEIEDVSVPDNKSVTADELAIAMATTLGVVGRDKIWDTKGDLAAATGADVASKLAVGADDLVLAADSSTSTGLKWKPRGSAGAIHLPTGALAATYDRAVAGGSQAALTSGTLNLLQIPLTAGMVITSISFKSGATALSAGTHQFFGLFDINRVALKFTSDDTSTGWAANTVKTLNLSASYTVLTTGDYYLGINVTATTVPTLLAVATAGANVVNIPPILAGNTSDTGLTAVPTIPFTAGAITSAVILPYAWVS